MVELIARDDFNVNWPDLIPQLVEQCWESTPEITLRVFRTMNPILKIIRFLSRSDKLYKMINYVMEKLAPALTFKTRVRSKFNVLGNNGIPRKHYSFRQRRVHSAQYCLVGIHDL